MFLIKLKSQGRRGSQKSHKDGKIKVLVLCKRTVLNKP